MELHVSPQQCEHCGSPSLGSRFCCNACEKLHHALELSFQSDKAQASPYSYLDEPNFRQLYTHADSDYNYVFYAEGLHCSSCVHLLEKLPEFYSEIESARVNFGYSTVSVALKSSGSLAHVAYIIRELGYNPAPLAQKDDFQEKYQKENRTFLKRIAVAGAAAGNIMLFVIPVYSGLAGPLATVFNWMSFLLFLPILFYSATPFYKGAWNSLKYKVINVDLPIAVAMLSSFALSTVNLARGSGDIYFDSTASFMFLILSARYLLKRTQQNYLSPTQLREFFKNERFSLLQGDNHWSLVPAEKLAPLQIVKIQTGQTIPADGELLSERAFVDTSLFNGESMPRHFYKGMTLFGGTKLLSSDIHLRLSSSQADSKVGVLLKTLDSSALNKTSFLALTDRLAQTLIMVVFSIAALFFTFYSWVDFSEAFNRSLALIVLACPCALAFGSPLTFGLSLKKAQKMGILIKEGSVLERIRKVKNLFFDKTGTLTQGQLELTHTEPAVLDTEIIRSVLAIEASSYHPIAFAVRQAWSSVDRIPSAKNCSEALGSGVRGQIENSHWEVKQLSESLHDSELAVGVYRDGKIIAHLYFADQLRDESPRVIEELRKWGIESHLLTGDRKSRALDIADKCHIPREQTHAELFPEDKQKFVQSQKDSCMIGDGANDSLALKAADVGIAMKGSVDLSLSAGDVYFTRGGLEPLLDLLRLSKQTEKVLIRNLTLSLVYNLAGGTLALLGFINPLLAAILMPISSIVIIISSIWGLK